MMNKFNKIKKFILNLIYPKKCVGCGKWGTWLCKKCRLKLLLIKTPFCPICRKLTSLGQLCSRCRGKYYFTGVIAAGYYQGILKELIHYYKYRKIKSISIILSNILIRKLEQGMPSGKLVFIPIPLHQSKFNERGFNQSEIIAKRLSQAYDIPFYDCLIRKKKTKSQIGLSKKERTANMQNAFDFNKKYQKEIIKKTPILIDDVATSCSTLNQAAKILRQNKARNVWCLVIAKD